MAAFKVTTEVQAMRPKEQQHVDSLEKEYQALKARYPGESAAIQATWQAKSEKGLEPVVAILNSESEVRALDEELSEAEEKWLSTRTNYLTGRATTLWVPLPPYTDSEVWQKIRNSLVLTDQGVINVENAIQKEERERSVVLWSKFAVGVSILALILSGVALLHTLQKDTQPSAQTYSQTAPTGQPSSGAAKPK